MSVKSIMKKYPCPSDHPVYKRYWNILLPEVVSRDKFLGSHILMLETVCELYQQEKHLRDLCDFTGFTYDAGEGRNGESKRITPEANLLTQTRNQISQYLKALGLHVKDPRGSASGSAPKELEDEWE